MPASQMQVLKLHVKRRWTTKGKNKARLTEACRLHFFARRLASFHLMASSLFPRTWCKPTFRLAKLPR